MARKKVSSPYAAFNGEGRYEAALRVAGEYGLDVSQVLFAYLKIAAPLLEKLPAGKAQPQIDAAFTAFLQSTTERKPE